MVYVMLSSDVELLLCMGQPTNVLWLCMLLKHLKTAVVTGCYCFAAVVACLEVGNYFLIDDFCLFFCFITWYTWLTMLWSKHMAAFFTVLLLL